MHVAGKRISSGQKFRSRSETLTGSASFAGRRAWLLDYLTAGRYSYYRYSESRRWAPNQVDQRRTGRRPSSHRSNRSILPWAAVSRSVVAPEARVFSRPAPLPLHGRNAGSERPTRTARIDAGSRKDHHTGTVGSRRQAFTW